MTRAREQGESTGPSRTPSTRPSIAPSPRPSRPAEPSEDYRPPDLAAPLPTKRILDGIPSDATVKTGFLRAIVRDLEENGHHLPHLQLRSDFIDHSTREAAEVLLLAADRLYPDVPKREALRRLGWSIFPAFLSMVIGRVVFGALNHDVHAIAAAAPRGLAVSMSHARCTVAKLEATAIELSIVEYHLFPDCFLLGVIEGGLLHCGYEASRILVRPSGLYGCDFFIQLVRD